MRRTGGDGGGRVRERSRAATNQIWLVELRLIPFHERDKRHIRRAYENYPSKLGKVSYGFLFRM